LPDAPFRSLSGIPTRRDPSRCKCHPGGRP
jgi:hypothetical protein